MRDKKVTTTIQIAYTGAAADFSWVLPLPNTPESFDVASDAVFRALHQFTDPTFSVTYNTTCSNFNVCQQFADRNIVLDASSNGGGSKVRILLTGDVGPFTYTVIAATESDKTGAALFQWLKDNKFGVPEIAMPIVARYVRLNYRFVTLKLQKGKAVGELVPIVIRYAAPSTVDMSCVPLRLTAVAAEEMPVYVWIAGDYRAVPQNFVHLTPDLRKLPWLQCAIRGNYFNIDDSSTAFGGRSMCTKEYVDLLKATAQAFGVQKWLTTEYAGALPMNMLDAIYNPRVMPFDKARLASATSAQEFLMQAIAGLPFDLRTSPVMQALLKEFMPKPDDVSKECESDSAFYAIGGDCLDDYDSFNAKATADAIEARLIAPTRNARAELAKFPYMTRFYGVFAPQNMVRDPIFRFVKDSTLPAVNNAHTITASFKCDQPTFDLTLTFEDNTAQVISGVKRGDSCGLVGPTDAPAIADDTAHIDVLQADNVDGKLTVKRLNSSTVVVEDDALSALDGSVMGAAFDPNFCNLGGKGCSCLAGSCGIGLACDAATNKCVISSAALAVPSVPLVVGTMMALVMIW